MASTALVDSRTHNEITRFVDEAIFDLGSQEKLGKLYQELLPVERQGFDGAKLDVGEVDQNLAARFNVIDVDHIMAKMRHRRFEVPVPYFAMYNVFRNDDGCKVRYIRSFEGFRMVEGDFPAAANEKILEILRRHEKIGIWKVFWVIAGLGALGMFALLTATTIMPWWLNAFVACVLGSLLGFLAFVAPRADADIVLFTRFAGFIPGHIRQKIVESKGLFSEIFLIQEVDLRNWKATTIPKPRAADPLLVGKKNGVYYLIDRFDTTTLEEYMAREFST